MKDIIKLVLGSGKELAVWQMADRAALMFFIAIILVRISGRRSFGMKSPFDTTIAILLGALLSRAIAGAAPWWPTVAAGLMLVVLHRVLAWGVIKSPALARLVRGGPITLYKDGKIIKDNMIRSLVSEEELRENVRLKANVEGFEKVASAYLETTGEIAVIKKES